MMSGSLLRGLRLLPARPAVSRGWGGGPRPGVVAGKLEGRQAAQRDRGTVSGSDPAR